jgi:hypothetical protein
VRSEKYSEKESNSELAHQLFLTVYGTANSGLTIQQPPVSGHKPHRRQRSSPRNPHLQPGKQQDLVVLLSSVITSFSYTRSKAY